MTKTLRLLLLVLVAVACAPVARAHVGNKDVYETVQSGPYKLYVTIRMPNVIPGVAVVEARSSGAPVSSIHITPMPMAGEAAKHPPASDAMKASSDDPKFFTGSVWLMASGSWQIRFDIAGSSGTGTMSVPVPAVAVTTLRMQRNLGMILGVLGLFLVIGMAGIIGAAVRESRLPPGVTASPLRRRMGLIAAMASLAVMALIVWGGAKWWKVEAAGYAAGVYRPLEANATLSSNILDVRLKAFDAGESFERRSRSNDDLLLDHGHLMHLYAIRMPEMDVVAHLHPSRVAPGDMRMMLPALPAGRYMLYGDIVHANGFPETIVSTMDVPAHMFGDRLTPDDAVAEAAPLSKGELGTVTKLPDGYTMVWDKPGTLTANTGYQFHFSLLKPDGSPADDVVPYMGMAGHAAFVRTDGAVFAHTHPEGSAAMAAMMLANGNAQNNAGSMPGMDMSSMPGMDMSSMAGMQKLSNVVEFPYGFPSPGRYRIFIQMKHGSVIETGIFDAAVQ